MTPEDERCENWLMALLSANIKDKRIFKKIQKLCLDLLKVPEDNRVTYMVLIKSEIETRKIIKRLEAQEAGKKNV